MFGLVDKLIFGPGINAIIIKTRPVGDCSLEGMTEAVARSGLGRLAYNN